MSTASDAMPEARPRAAVNGPATRPFYWSVRRELWESRSLYVAPLAVAALVLFGFMLSLLGIAQRAAVVTTLPSDKQAALVVAPYDAAAVAIILTGFIVAFFYCLGALYNERRDRSILFWKSLPVSDVTTVASKAFVPLVAVPAIVFAVVIVLQLLMLVVHSAGRVAIGESVATLWQLVNPLQGSVVLLYGVVTFSIWHAPVYGWLLLVSAWARRSPILWAVLPPLAVSLVERIAFDTHFFGRLISQRVFGGFEEAFDFTPHAPGAAMIHNAIPVIGISQLDPVKFVTSPGTWIGLVLAAAFLAGAVWLRRYRDPI